MDDYYIPKPFNLVLEMILNDRKKVVAFRILLSFFTLELFYFVYANQNSLVKIEVLVNECLNENNLVSCKKSLVSLEDLQVKAVKNRMYSCQTRILGLEADLIMQTHGLIRAIPALERLDEVKSSC